MTVSVNHATVAAGPNDPTKQVSSDAWNATHTVTGLATVAGTGAYSDLTGTPALATVATTGAYSDLSGKPTLGTAAASAIGDFDAAGAATAAVAALSAWSHVASGTGPITISSTGVSSITAQTGTGTTFATQASPTFTGQVFGPDGLVGTPGFAFGTETNTGLYRSSSGNIALAVAGTARYRWNAGGMTIDTGMLIGWGSGDALSAVDTIIRRDAANTLAQRNAASAQTSRVYGTFTDASNYVRASLAVTSTTVTLAAESAGTGAADISLTLTPKGAGVVTAPLYASSYSPGSFTLATETCAVIANHLKLSGTQRATLSGTSRLVLL